MAASVTNAAQAIVRKGSPFRLTKRTLTPGQPVRKHHRTREFPRLSGGFSLAIRPRCEVGRNRPLHLAEQVAASAGDGP
jgi:hypothetical protein